MDNIEHIIVYFICIYMSFCQYIYYFQDISNAFIIITLLDIARILNLPSSCSPFVSRQGHTGQALTHFIPPDAVIIAAPIISLPHASR